MASTSETLVAEAREPGAPPESDFSVGLLQDSYANLPYVAYIDELKLAVEHREASFEQTVLALYLAGYRELGAEAASLRALHPQLLRAFEASHGRVEEARYGHYAVTAAVLTTAASADDSTTRRERERGADRPDVALPQAVDLEAFAWWQWIDFDAQDANALLAEILQLRDRITTFLPLTWARAPVARDIALRQLYGIASELVQSIDDESLRAQGQTRPEGAKTRPADHHVRTIARLRKRVEDTTAVYLASARRLAQREYVNWMLVGLLVLLVPLAALGVATAALDWDAAWVSAASAGAIGAVISVLQRMARGPLDLNPEGDRDTFRLLGAARPAIGSVLGVASYILVGGGLIALTPPTGTTDKALYFAGIAFLAGFSERFAQDMLISSSRFGKTKSPAGG